MNVGLFYVFPNLKLSTYEPLARRFVQSYQEFTPGDHPHTLNVIVNGSQIEEWRKRIFSPLPVDFIEHNNFAKDIGGFMLASIYSPCDLMVCMGAHTHFHRAGWLDRIMDIYYLNGPGLYGCWGFEQPSPHIRTTFFCIPPTLLSTYPHKIDNEHRYNFEHGARQSILQWSLQNELPVAMISWSRVGLYPEFFSVSHDDSLVLDQHQDRQAKK